MATLVTSRNPLATMKPLVNHVSATIAPWQTSSRKPSSTSKRAHSPEPGDSQSQSAKRPRAVSEHARTTRDDVRKKEAKETREPKEDKDRRRAEREEEFRYKYTRAFPSWTFCFHFDADTPELAAVKHKLQRRVEQMGAHIEDFFQKTITHLIVLDPEAAPGKENSRSRKQDSGGLLGSPIRLKTQPGDGTRVVDPIKRAQEYDIKVWGIEKLSSVLDRCQGPPASSVANPTLAPVRSTSVTTKERQLSRLLESERLHGTTERDPTQRRHDYVYFSKGSYYVLVEDMRQELATIAALEYPIQRTRDGKERGSWPILYCHPRARGPFLEYNEREERRREKVDQADKDREEELAKRKAQLREQERRRRAKLHAQVQAQQHRDLRRVMSMQNLRRHISIGDEDTVEVDAGSPDCEVGESAAASGYLASGAYVAASGNSVSITSATGTTSTAGATFRALRLPPLLRDKIEHQVVTSRRLPNSSRRTGKENLMGPPLAIPDRPQRTLRKSKSTTTMRLAKRDEGMKPGYCECCRVKFDDFKHHIYSKKHRKFAEDDSNFAQLDIVLSRVTRRTIEEVHAEQAVWDDDAEHDHGEDDDLDAPGEIDVDGEYEDDMTLHTPVEDDVQWDEWVEDEDEA